MPPESKSTSPTSGAQTPEVLLQQYRHQATLRLRWFLALSLLSSCILHLGVSYLWMGSFDNAQPEPSTELEITVTEILEPVLESIPDAKPEPEPPVEAEQPSDQSTIMAGLPTPATSQPFTPEPLTPKSASETLPGSPPKLEPSPELTPAESSQASPEPTPLPSVVNPTEEVPVAASPSPNSSLNPVASPNPFPFPFFPPPNNSSPTTAPNNGVSPNPHSSPNSGVTPGALQGGITDHPSRSNDGAEPQGSGPPKGNNSGGSRGTENRGLGSGPIGTRSMPPNSLRPVRPVCLSCPKPSFQDTEASPKVDMRIRPDGSVEVRLLQSSGNPRLDQATLDAMSKWRFDPKTVPEGGVQQRVRVTYEEEGSAFQRQNERRRRQEEEQRRHLLEQQRQAEEQQRLAPSPSPGQSSSPSPTPLPTLPPSPALPTPSVMPVESPTASPVAPAVPIPMPSPIPVPEIPPLPAPEPRPESPPLHH